jgi:hypothetical protein
VHYLLDFSSTLGAGNDDWKSPRYGHEYFFDPGRLALRAVTLGIVHPAWDDVPLAHPALGYFDADTFDPEAWRTTYPNPLFDAATTRDAFWGARLVSSLTDDDLRVVARAAEWSDARAEVILVDLLSRRNAPSHARTSMPAASPRSTRSGSTRAAACAFAISRSSTASPPRRTLAIAAALRTAHGRRPRRVRLWLSRRRRRRSSTSRRATTAAAPGARRYARRSSRVAAARGSSSRSTAPRAEPAFRG